MHHPYPIPRVSHCDRVRSWPATGAFDDPDHGRGLEVETKQVGGAQRVDTTGWSESTVARERFQQGPPRRTYPV
jgi:hypothetical protein